MLDFENRLSCKQQKMIFPLPGILCYTMVIDLSEALVNLPMIEKAKGRVIDFEVVLSNYTLCFLAHRIDSIL